MTTPAVIQVLKVILVQHPCDEAQELQDFATCLSCLQNLMLTNLDGCNNNCEVNYNIGIKSTDFSCPDHASWPLSSESLTADTKLLQLLCDHSASSDSLAATSTCMALILESWAQCEAGEDFIYAVLVAQMVDSMQSLARQCASQSLRWIQQLQLEAHGQDQLYHALHCDVAGNVQRERGLRAHKRPDVCDPTVMRNASIMTVLGSHFLLQSG